MLMIFERQRAIDALQVIARQPTALRELRDQLNAGLWYSAFIAAGLETWGLAIKVGSAGPDRWYLTKDGQKFLQAFDAWLPSFREPLTIPE